MRDARRWHLGILAALLKKRYKEEDIKKILGGNVLRVMRANFGK